MEDQLGMPLVQKQTGGQGGGGARLTPEAEDLLSKYSRLAEGLEEEVDEKFREIFL
jgi:molybdate transport system regulatory protein